MQTDKKLQQNNDNLELWGGMECTINRINDQYFDQLEYANHYNRKGDLDLIIELGIKTLRYPILWERHQPTLNTDIDWTWSEKQLNNLTNKGVQPIAGLMHHGSGPKFTNLLHDNFAAGLASYAEKVAQKFPWIEYYTPINEPLTTARFSGLYGLWYPHLQNDISFAKMILNQMKAVVLSMQAIRKINPAAKLIQTEDLGKTYSTPILQYQSNFENIRRWLTYDLLCGNIKQGHVMWNHFKRLGIEEDSLNFFIENTCPPDIMGFNYYITSERYLDENVENYPPEMQGGNELQAYVDVEAIRIHHNQPNGLKFLLKEAWEKYKLPIAITEAHLNCGREDQKRWFKEIWDDSLKLKIEGLDIKAVTAWSLFGSFGWDKLLTSKKMNYEIGAFDIRSGIPRATGLTAMIKDLATTQNYEHPILGQKGWWQTESRFLYESIVETHLYYNNGQPILIVGKNRTLGRAFEKICNIRHLHYRLLGSDDVDITNEHQIEKIVKLYNPWVIINATGYENVDSAEVNIKKCFAENCLVSYLLSTSCKKHGIQFLTFSSDLVFDGNTQKPYVEQNKTNPLNVYGRSKAQAEFFVMENYPNSLIVRTSSLFGPRDSNNFISTAINAMNSKKKLNVTDDVIISPTYVPDLVNASLDLLVDNESGIWHLTNNGEISWADFAYLALNMSGVNTDLIDRKPLSFFNLKAKLPNYSVLKSEKGVLLPSIQDALERFIDESNLVSIKNEIMITNKLQ